MEEEESYITRETPDSRGPPTVQLTTTPDLTLTPFLTNISKDNNDWFDFYIQNLDKIVQISINIQH